MIMGYGPPEGPCIPHPPGSPTSPDGAIGKTIAAITWGRQCPHEHVHAAETVIFAFADGSHLQVLIGSNSWNLEKDGYRREHDGHRLKSEDFSADFMWFLRRA